MKKLKNIHLVCKSGPEWQIPIKSFSSNKKAQAFAAERNEAKGEGTYTHGVLDSLSEYTVDKVEHDG